MHLKKGDNVIITTGKDAGEKGEVIALDLAKNRVKVERRNMITKHRKRNPLTGDDGARIEMEGWMSASNVAIFSEKAGGPVRTQSRYVGKGGEHHALKKDAIASFGAEPPTVVKKVRVAQKTGEVFE